MKVHSARQLSYNANKTAKGIKQLDLLIEKAARSGKFEISTEIYADWGCRFDLVEYYKKQGYDASYTSRQVSPNDSDYFIRISWKE